MYYCICILSFDTEYTAPGAVSGTFQNIPIIVSLSLYANKHARRHSAMPVARLCLHISFEGNWSCIALCAFKIASLRIELRTSSTKLWNSTTDNVVNINDKDGNKSDNKNSEVREIIIIIIMSISNVRYNIVAVEAILEVLGNSVSDK